MKYLFTSLLLVFSIAAFSQVDSSLVAHYPFDGNADDVSGNGNHGAVDGPILTTDRFGEADSAYEFDGVDDIIRVMDAASLRLEDDFTLVAWVLPYTTKDHTILRKNSSAHNIPAYPAYGIGLSGTSHFAMTIGSDEGRQGISSQQAFFNRPYEVNNWYRMIARKQDTSIYITTMVFDKNVFSNYQRSMKGSIPYDGSPLIIGSRTQQAANTFEGKIDDIKIYNRFMTLEEVTGLSFDDDEIEEEEMEMDDDSQDDEMDDDSDMDNDSQDDEMNDDSDMDDDSQDDDGDLDDENTDDNLFPDVKVIIDPWQFLLITSETSTIENVKLSKDGALVLDQDKDAMVVSINIENFEKGQYLLTLKLSDDDYEQLITIE